LKRAIFTLVILMAFVLSLSLITYNAYAKPRTHAYCWTTDDYGDNPLCKDGAYDPSDNYINWTFDFYVEEGQNRTILRMWIQGDNGWNGVYADSDDFNENQAYHLYGSEKVGPSTNHTLRVDRAGGTSGGRFTDIEAEVFYLADQPLGGGDE